MRGPNDIDPIAAARLLVRIGEHLDEAIAVGVTAEQVLQRAFASGFLAREPRLVSGEVEQLGDVVTQLGCESMR